MIAWRDLPSLRDPDRFDAWVHRLLTNVCIDRGRSGAQAGQQPVRAPGRRIRPRRTSCWQSPIETSSIAASGGSTPDERAILVLRHFVGYEPTEIAETPRHLRGDDPFPPPSRPSRHARRTRSGRPRRGRRRDLSHERTAPTSTASSRSGWPTARPRSPIASSTSSPPGSASSASAARGAFPRRTNVTTPIKLIAAAGRGRSSSPSAATACHGRPARAGPAGPDRPHRRRRPSPSASPSAAPSAGCRVSRLVDPTSPPVVPGSWPPGSHATRGLQCPASPSACPRAGLTTVTRRDYFELFPDTPANQAEFARSGGFANSIIMGLRIRAPTSSAIRSRTTAARRQPRSSPPWRRTKPSRRPG